MPYKKAKGRVHTRINFHQTRGRKRKEKEKFSGGRGVTRTRSEEVLVRLGTSKFKIPDKLK